MYLVQGSWVISGSAEEAGNEAAENKQNVIMRSLHDALRSLTGILKGTSIMEDALRGVNQGFDTLAL